MSTETIELQEVMQGYFPWHKARVRFIAAFIVSLIKLTSVNFTKLANALNGNVKQKSNIVESNASLHTLICPTALYTR